MMLMVIVIIQSAKAQQNFSDIKGRAIFPIVNKYEGNTSIEFIAADAIDGNRYAPRIPHYYRTEKMWHFKDGTPSLIQASDLGGDWFVSLNYISQTKGNGVTWNSGANTTQFVFHPGNHSSEKEVLYAFLWKYGDLVYNQLPSETSGLNVMYKDIKNNETYTLSGRKLDKPQKGINIAKGKKFVVK